jgi:hypothetical protein
LISELNFLVNIELVCVGAEIVFDRGEKVNVFSVCVLCTRLSLNFQEIGDDLAVVSHLMLVLGDFNTHSQSWSRGCLMDFIWFTLMTEHSQGLLHHLRNQASCALWDWI